mgnify:CR=1 FL=1
MKRRVFSIVLVLLFLFTFISPIDFVNADDEWPKWIPSNKPEENHPDLKNFDSTNFKVDPPKDGNYPNKDPLISVTFHNGNNEEGITHVDWSVIDGKNIEVHYVFVKGGEGGGGYLYKYAPAETSDTGLHALENKNHEGTFHDISHVVFYYSEVEQEEPPPPTATLKIEKEVIDAEEGEETNFAFTVTGPGISGEDGSFSLKHGENITFKDIDIGSYTITEDQVSGYEIDGFYKLEGEEETELPTEEGKDDSLNIELNEGGLHVIVKNEKQTEPPPNEKTIKIKKKLLTVVNDKEIIITDDDKEFTVAFIPTAILPMSLPENSSVKTVVIKASETEGADITLTYGEYYVEEADPLYPYEFSRIEGNVVEEETGRYKITIDEETSDLTLTVVNSRYDIVVEKEMVDEEGETIWDDNTNFNVTFQPYYEPTLYRNGYPNVTINTSSTNTITLPFEGQYIISENVEMPYKLIGIKVNNELLETDSEGRYIADIDRNTWIITIINEKTISEEPWTGSIKVIKKAKDKSGNELSKSGFTFELYEKLNDSWSKKGESLTTDTNGEIVFNGLVEGEYKLKETGSDYTNDLDHNKIFVIRENNKDHQIIITNIKKSDDNGGNGGDNGGNGGGKDKDDPRPPKDSDPPKPKDPITSKTDNKKEVEPREVMENIIEVPLDPKPDVPETPVEEPEIIIEEPEPVAGEPAEPQPDIPDLPFTGGPIEPELLMGGLGTLLLVAGLSIKNKKR